MTTHEQNEYDEAYHFLGLERARALETELGHLYQINDPNLSKLCSRLAESSPYAIYEPNPQKDIMHDNRVLGNTVRISTSSEKNGSSAPQLFFMRDLSRYEKYQQKMKKIFM